MRFLVYGFGPLLTAFNKSTVQTVYMHVFQPGGRRRGTFNVGRTSGACGDLRTRRRKILPFGAQERNLDLPVHDGQALQREVAPPVGGRLQGPDGLQAGVALAVAAALVNTSSPSAASTRTVSPSENSPSRIASASLSTRCFWMTRLSGRAP